MHIELRDVAIRYGRVHALDNVSLSIEPGQIVAVLGPNGAGKTTLLRSLCGVVSPSGEIIMDGAPFTRGEMALRRRIAFLPDFPAAFPNMTVLRHIGMVLKLYGANVAAAEPRAMELLRGFDLMPLIDTPIGNLSRGQIYKTTLTALLLADTELLLLDEPFASGMDPSGIAFLKRLIREIATRGKTVLYSTQILDIAERVSDRLCVVDRGKIRYFAPASELQSAPGEQSPLDQLFATLRETAQ